MIVLDTHALIWWVGGAPELGLAASEAIESADRIVVPSIVCWEVALLVARGRVTVDRSPEEWLWRVLAVPGVELWPLTPPIAVLANTLDGGFHRDPADRLIVSTAIHVGVPLVTRDAKIIASGVVETVW